MMESQFGFHGKPPTPEQAEQALSELEASSADRRGAGAARCTAGEPEPVPTRKAYGDALVELGERHDDVVALDADLAVSTQSIEFGKRFPERFFNVGAAEANMMSMACGLATTGKVPYASTFAIFATGRAYDQVRLGHRPQRAEGQGLRLPRRPVARRGRRLTSDDRGHRADARDAEDAGGGPGRLQPGLPRRARELRARGPDVHALRASGDAVRLRRDSRDPRRRRRRPARGQDISIFACGHMVWRALEAAEIWRARTASRPRS